MRTSQVDAAASSGWQTLTLLGPARVYRVTHSRTSSAACTTSTITHRVHRAGAQPSSTACRSAHTGCRTSPRSAPTSTCSRCTRCTVRTSVRCTCGRARRRTPSPTHVFKGDALAPLHARRAGSCAGRASRRRRLFEATRGTARRSTSARAGSSVQQLFRTHESELLQPSARLPRRHPRVRLIGATSAPSRHRPSPSRTQPVIGDARQPSRRVEHRCRCPTSTPTACSGARHRHHRRRLRISFCTPAPEVTA